MNCDKTPVNDHGRQLLSLYKASDVHILNGRTLGDTHGAFTCSSHGGNPSAIDYFLCNDRDLVRCMLVDRPEVHSIHCMMSCIFLGGAYSVDECAQSEGSPFKKYIWRPEDSLKFAGAFETSTVKDKVDNCISSGASIDELVEQSTRLLTDVADGIGVRLSTGRKKRKRHSGRKWFDRDCHHLKKELWKLRGQIKREPFRLDLQVQFRKRRKDYNKLISKKRRLFKDEITAKMKNVYRSNPSRFGKFSMT